jgi:DNA-binding NtrC family response regulator
MNEGGATMATRKVLLIGDAETRPTWLLDKLASLEVESYFVPGRADVLRMLRLHRFSFILAKLRLPDASAFDLVPLVRGISVDLYAYLQAGNGTWWVPLVKDGTECVGVRPLKRDAFVRMLAQLLAEQPSAEMDTVAGGRFRS